MHFQRTWALRGPNFWWRGPSLEAELDLEERAGFRPVANSAFTERLNIWLPAVSPGETLAHDVLHVAQTLQRLLGETADFGAVQTTSRAGFYRLLLSYDEEAIGRACLESARELCLAAVEGREFDVAVRLRQLRDLAHESRLGPSTASIVRAARRRGIPVRRLNTGSLVQLGQGAHQRRILTAETDQTSVIAEAVAQDKELTRALLHNIGVPVPQGRAVADPGEAWRAAEELGLPVVVKPQYGNQGRGVATDLGTREQVVRAYAAARQESSYILVERFIPGADFRVLVVGERVVAASRREPAHVMGDGRSTVAQLIDEANRDPRRSDGHATALSYIKADEIGCAVLAEQGYTIDSVPAAGQRVLLRRNGNLSTGGTATDVTDQVHPDVAARAIEAARVVGLDVAGVDVVTTDIARSFNETGGAIVEVNAGPGLRMHLEPSAGKPRDVGEAIVDSLFPPGGNGRIPIVAVTGVNGKTTTTRLLAHLLAGTGRFVGMTCTDGLYLDGRRTQTRDCAGPQSARTVLLNPRVETAVLETARGGILREGLGFDRCDVAVVTNIGKGDHFGLRGIETLDDLARVKRTVVAAVAPQGTAVLNAADPLVVAMASHCPGSIIYFALDETCLASASSGQVVFVRDGAIILRRGEREEAVTSLTEVPLTCGGKVAFQIENVLAVTAAAWALGVSLDVIRIGLRSFHGGPSQSPGRFNVLEIGGATVIVDYAHNPSAVAALVEALDSFGPRRRTAVFSACDRRENDLVEMGELLARAFDRVILYQDRGHSGRADGELNQLLRRGLDSGGRVNEVIEVAEELPAIETALATLGAGDLLVLGVDSYEQALALVESRSER
jgi:cyanophycin synthetase